MKRIFLSSFLAFGILSLNSVFQENAFSQSKKTESNKEVKVSNNPLMMAIEIADIKEIKKLIAKGYSVNSKDQNGFTALMSASNKGYKDITDLLTSLGADVNLKDNSGKTALMYSSNNGNDMIVANLIKMGAGAGVNIKDNFGKTARDYALIAEGYDYSLSSSDYVSSDSLNVLSAVGAGIAAGLCTYALCTLFQKSASEPILRADSSSYYYYDYCAKCSAYVGYTADPLQLYCSSCYRAYCKQQQVYNSYQSSYRMSDRL